jgi:chorismate mutase/prephenate dehydratase
MDTEHERKILYRLCEQARPELSGYVKVLFSSLFELSRSHQKAQSHYDSAVKKLLDDTAAYMPEFPSRTTVACQGVEGAYSQAACDKLFSPADITYFNSFEGVFQAVDGGLCRFGVVPLENSSAGSVNEVYALMNRYRFYIVRSIKLPVTHTLLAVPGAKLDDIKEVFSHEQAIRQCSRFLKSWNGVKITECANTAMAAKQAASSGRMDAAVISSRDCAELYGLSALSYNIQNTDNNYTRFICISKKLEIYPGAHKTSLILALKHKPGSLYHVLAKFYAHGINMNKLESHPISGQNFEFMFYFDIDTPVISDELKQVLTELEQETDMFSFLGTYQEF